MEGKTPPRPGAESIVKLLSALTILALMIQGVLMLQWQVTTLSQKPARHRKPLPSVAPTARLPENSRVAKAFEEAMKKAREKPHQPPPHATREAKIVYSYTKDQVFDNLRQFYANQGIRNEEYVAIMALEQTDREWNKVFRASDEAKERKDFGEARQLLEGELSRLDQRHLLAKIDLLEELSQVEFAAANPQGGQARLKELDETRILTARIMAQALQEKKEDGVSAQEAADLVSGMETARDARQENAKIAEMFAGQGDDPHEAPKKAYSLLVEAAKIQMKKEGTAPPSPPPDGPPAQENTGQ